MRTLMTAAVAAVLALGAGCAAGEESRREEEAPQAQARTETTQQTTNGYVVTVKRTERDPRVLEQEAAERARRAEAQRVEASRRAAEARARAEASAKEAQRLQSAREQDQQRIAAARQRAQEESQRAEDANAELERRQQELDAARQAQLQFEQELQQQRAELERQREALEQREQALQREQQARAEAERRAREALDQVAGVRKEARGLVVTLGGEVLFGFNEAVLLPSAQQRLDVVASALRQMSEGEVLIEGHTDSVGSEEYNEELSVRRAEAVRQYLQDRGVSAEQIRATGYGELRPVASNASSEGRANNRRVEIVLPEYGTGGAGGEQGTAPEEERTVEPGATGDTEAPHRPMGTGGAGKIGGADEESEAPERAIEPGAGEPGVPESEEPEADGTGGAGEVGAEPGQPPQPTTEPGVEEQDEGESRRPEAVEPGTGGAGTEGTDAEIAKPPPPINGDLEGPPTPLDDIEEDELLPE